MEGQEIRGHLPCLAIGGVKGRPFFLRGDAKGHIASLDGIGLRKEINVPLFTPTRGGNLDYTRESFRRTGGSNNSAR